MLDKALCLAAEGFRVFPLIEGGKVPAVSAWNVRASHDPDKVRAMWSSHDPVMQVTRVRDYNIGIATGRTRDGFVMVMDVDVKQGAKGRDTLAALDLTAPDDWLNTRSVTTWSGGTHYFYTTPFPMANSASTRLGSGIDTRGEGGFVVAPGSIVEGKPYVDNGGTVRAGPLWLCEMVGTAPDKAEGGSQVLCMLDTAPAVQRATTHLLHSAPVAIQGEGGNATTLKVAARIKDFGLSQQGCTELLFEHWNDRCEPPWEWEELAVVVSNAYRYGQNGIGSSSPENDFEPVEDDEVAPPTRRPIPGFDTTITAAALATTTFTPIRWAVEGLFPEGLTILAGRPKIGKSWLAGELATETGVGGRLLRAYKCHQGAVLYLALEDKPRRMKERLLRMDAPMPANVFIQHDWKRLDAGGVEAIAAWLDEQPDARLVIIDTLAKVKPRARKGAGGYDADAEALAPLQRMAMERQIAVVLIHHDRKVRDDDWLNSISGTLGLAGVADTLALIRRPRGAGEANATLNITGRDVEETEIRLAFDKTTGRWSVDNTIVLDDFDDVPPEQSKILRLLRDAGPAGMKLAVLAEHVAKGKANVANMLKKLKADGVVVHPSRGVWALSKLE